MSEHVRSASWDRLHEIRMGPKHRGFGTCAERFLGPAVHETRDGLRTERECLVPRRSAKPAASRVDGVSSLKIRLPYTRTCRAGLLALCLDEPTTLIVAHGAEVKTYWCLLVISLDRLSACDAASFIALCPPSLGGTP